MLGAYFIMINLKITKLEKHYNQPLLDDVSVNFAGTGVIALIGDNGCGKTTLLKILAGEETVDGGTVEWSFPPRIGFLLQEVTGLDELSGGQKKIALLSELIYSNQYDVLLLDEPDNHLDLDNKIWFRQALSDFDGLVIMISHDRTTLKAVTNRTWLVEDRSLRSFPFGYAKFVSEYEKEKETQTHLFEVQQKEHKRLKELVAIFRIRARNGPKHARYFHALEKRLARFEAGMVTDPRKKDTHIIITSKLTGKQIDRKTAIFTKDLSFFYDPGSPVFDKADFHLFVGDKVALLSPNGSGKSTLVKLLLGQLTPTSGRAELGNNLKVGYYTQDNLEALDENLTPIGVFMARHPLFEHQVEGILRRFFFTKHTCKSRIGSLSGGQKARLQLALFLYENPDILILDEPTNHLDIKSIQALETFLKDFPGTIFLISHDHELVENVADLVYEIKNQKILLT